MASEMMAVQHSWEGLLRFILPDDTVTVDVEVMTLLGVHIFKHDKHISEKGFIPWSKENTPPPAFLKRVREMQTKNSKEFLESILDQDLEPNFRPKQPCRCPKVAKLSNSQFIQDQKMKMTTKTTETTQNSIPVTVRNMEMQDPKQSRPPKPSRKLPYNSDWSKSTPLRCPSTYPKVLNLGRGRGKGKAPQLTGQV